MRVSLAILGILCAAQAADFHVSVDLVPVTFAVTSPDGQPVLDMRPDEFAILDNGEPRKVQSLWREMDLPLTIGLVADISGSLESFVSSHRKTIKQFLERVLEPQDQAFLVAVGSRVKLITDLTHSVPDLDAGAARLDPAKLFNRRWRADRTNFGEQCPVPDRMYRSVTRPSCGTLLWNGIYSTARLIMKPMSGRKALLVWTDGLDEGSNRTLTDAIEAAQDADTVVYTIYYARRPMNTPRSRLAPFG